MRQKVFDKYKRVNIFLNEPQLRAKADIKNFSAFVQICVDNSIDIMAWALLRDIDPKKYHLGHDREKVLTEFNTKFPQDPLVNKKKDTWPKNSPKKPEAW